MLLAVIKKPACFCADRSGGINSHKEQLSHCLCPGLIQDSDPPALTSLKPFPFPKKGFHKKDPTLIKSRLLSRMSAPADHQNSPFAKDLR